MYHSPARRKLVIAQKESGKTLIEIHEELNIPYSTVKRIWQDYQKRGESSLSLKYNNCGLKSPKYYKMYRRCTWLKRKHPDWGAPFILTILRERYPLEPIPCIRIVQKWFRRKKLIKTYIIREQVKIENVKEVHDCWQIDAKERIELLDKTKTCYLTTVDVKSGAILETPVFPPRLYQSGKCYSGKTIFDTSI